MSVSSSAASSTISRSRLVVATCIAVTAVVGIYYLNSTFNDTGDSGDANTSGSGLHRSNAIHRRRRNSLRNINTPQDGRDRRRSAVEAPQDDIFEDEELLDRPPAHPPLRELSPLDLETIVDEDDWVNPPPSDPRTGQNVVQLLFRVSEEATRQSSYVHRGCHCDSCGTVPIRGIRYRCSNCADYDLCEACEAQQLHNKTHIFYKIRVPAYSFSSRQAQPPCYPGQPDTALSQLPKSLIAKLSKETGFERQEIYAYWEQFTFMANTEWRDDPDGLCLAMDRITFDQCLVPSGAWRSVAPNLIFDRMFAFYDTNHDGLISFAEFLNGLAFRKKKDKLRKIFEGYDLDGDGYVDRKDFLRMFRSYYTMYKAIHRDLLEGLNDHTMSRTEAQQLISGRQPLSSAFAREMPTSGGSAGRAGEGKRAMNDELEVVDGNGVVNESGKDQGNKEDVIVDAVIREQTRTRGNSPRTTGSSDMGGFRIAVSQAVQSFAPDVNVRGAHWDAMLNPPQSIDELQHDVLEDLIATRQESVSERRRTPPLSMEAISRLRGLGSSAEDDELRNELLEGSFNTSNWPPGYVDDIDIETVIGESMPVNEVPEANRFDIIKVALRRRRIQKTEEEDKKVRNALSERWKRRQFYTDEEEGVTRPEYFDEEEDIPESAKMPGGLNHTAASTPPPLLSPRSRSSSKVRFAEDTDDYDIRSNPSTSSRSVPERWGGMEIPEAEKDSGKDILFQVTQQAYNELLDPIFKLREDMAMNVMATKKERDRHRHLFTDPDFEKWAKGVDQNAGGKSEDGDVFENDNDAFREMEAGIREGNGGEIPMPPEDDIENMSPDDIANIRHQPLEELLAASGYQLLSTTHNEPEIELISPNIASPSHDNPVEHPSEDNLEIEEIIEDSEEYEHVDPTLPQNRPNTTTTAPRVARFSKTYNEDYVAETVAPWSAPHKAASKSLTNGKGKGKAKEVDDADGFSPEPSRSRLYLLRNHDKYEEMAKQMGGWGRLDFREWERIIRAGSGGGKGGSGFEYLGSWIDICIP